MDVVKWVGKQIQTRLVALTHVIFSQNCWSSVLDVRKLHILVWSEDLHFPIDTISCSNSLLGWSTGLVHAVLNEKHSGTLVATLKALSLLVAAAP